MDYQVSARKYRPSMFDDVIGQPHVVQMLVNAITAKRIAHAFLFSGTRGVGKTTVARLLAKALNCERGPTSTPCGKCPNCLEIAQGISVEGIGLEDRSLASLARASEGSMRDALSLLDQAVAFAGKTVRQSDLETLLGSVPQEHIRAMISAILAQDSSAAVRIIAQLLDQGHDLRVYCGDLVEHIRNLLVAVAVPSSQELEGLIELSKDDVRQIETDARVFTVEQLQELFRIFSQAEDALRLSAHPRFVLEVAAVRSTRLLLPVPQAASPSPAALDAPRPHVSHPEPQRGAPPPGQLPGKASHNEPSRAASEQAGQAGQTQGALPGAQPRKPALQPANPPLSAHASGATRQP